MLKIYNTLTRSLDVFEPMQAGTKPAAPGAAPGSAGKVKVYGCGPTIAAASAVSEKVVGRTVEELLNLKPQEVEDAVDGLPDDRKHAADVVAGALRAAALDALRRRGGEA